MLKPKIAKQKNKTVRKTKSERKIRVSLLESLFGKELRRARAIIISAAAMRSL